MFFKGRRRSGRLSQSHLGPKVVRRVKMTSIRAAREVRAVTVGPVRLDCLSELWIGPEIMRDSSHIELKVYVYDQSYD